MALPFLESRSVREARLLAKHARRLVHRRRDLLNDTARANLDHGIGKLETAVRTRDERAVETAAQELDPHLVRLSPARSDSAWRENCEVLLMAIVVAVAVRAYFFQPFKIPTGSMQPTLNGILPNEVPPDRPLPGVASQWAQSLLLGKTYVDLISKTDDRIARLVPTKRLFFFDATRIECQSGASYTFPFTLTGHDSTADALRNTFRVQPGRVLRAGEPIARGYVATGDQVFVDKLTYHFRRPRRDDVFVFRTTGIAGIEDQLRSTDPEVRSQFYIKRLAGLPGDTLRIEAPELFINGQRAKGQGFERVMARGDGYRGYSFMGRLGSPKDTFTAPLDGYIALGDNSFHSSDSRYWGPVPERNLVGRGLFVYWPFTRHWGVIK